MEIHFSDGDLECPVGAATLFEEAALEGFGTAPDLWNIEAELAEGGLKTAGFKTVGLPIPDLTQGDWLVMSRMV